jgi:hypothetical protein
LPCVILYAVTLNVPQSPILVNAGKQLFVLHCEAVGNSDNFRLPQVTFQWIYSLQNDNSLQSVRHAEYNRQDLIFSPLKTSHAGQYTCTATMADLTESITIDLRGK